jgi:phage gp36-like protein
MYTSKDALSRILGATPLLELCDDAALGDWVTPDSDGVTNEERLNYCILQAGYKIDGFCRARWKVPFDPTPPMIVEVANTLTVYYLYLRRRGSFGMPEDVREEWSGAMKMLLKLNDGTLDPGVEPEPTVSSKDVLSNSGPEQLFTSDKLKGF